MALGTEAPSTGSQREPSRLEQNTNQRLTGHNHSPHQRAGRTPAHVARTCSTFYFPQSRMDECFDFSCHPGEVGKLKMRGLLHEFVCFCVCVCAPPVLSVSFSRYSGSAWWEMGCKTGAKSKPVLDWSETAMLASALRSASRVQNTNTNCPHNTGLLSDRRER